VTIGEELGECIAVEALEDARSAALVEEEIAHMDMGFAKSKDTVGSIGEEAQVSVNESSRYMGCAYTHCTSAAAAAEGTDSDCIAVASLAVALPADDGCSSYRLGK
jgi:hypothetical protein